MWHPEDNCRKRQVPEGTCPARLLSITFNPRHWCEQGNLFGANVRMVTYFRRRHEPHESWTQLLVIHTTTRSLIILTWGLSRLRFGGGKGRCLGGVADILFAYYRIRPLWLSHAKKNFSGRWWLGMRRCMDNQQESVKAFNPTYPTVRDRPNIRNPTSF